MPSYKYKALDLSGQLLEGLVDADNAAVARQILSQKGLILTNMSVVKASKLSSFFAPSLSSSEVVLFARQFSVLLSAGLTIEEALKALIDQAENKHFREVVKQLHAGIMEGMTLSESMVKRKKDFPVVFSMLVKAGEASGHLPEIMNLLADYLENRQALKQKVLGALIYPAIVTVFAISVVVLMMVYVVPQVIGIFTHTKHSLPFLTTCLVAISHFLSHFGYLLVSGIVMVIVIFIYWLRVYKNRFRFHQFLLNSPFVGLLILAFDAARFASTLSILLKGGVSFLQAMTISTDVVKSLPIKEFLENAANKVKEGSSLTLALSEKKLLPSILLHLISSGESTGDLPSLLEKASVILQRNAERRLLLFASLLEPVLILATGGIVLTIVLAVLMPILDMNTLIH